MLSAAPTATLGRISWRPLTGSPPPSIRTIGLRAAGASPSPPTSTPRRAADLPAAQCPGDPSPLAEPRHPAEMNSALLEQLARYPEARFYGRELERRYGVDLATAEAEGLVRQA